MPQALRYAIGVALWAKHNSVALKQLAKSTPESIRFCSLALKLAC
ncbi:hypothetical protein [Nostoc sp.]